MTAAIVSKHIISADAVTSISNCSWWVTDLLQFALQITRLPFHTAWPAPTSSPFFLRLIRIKHTCEHKRWYLWKLRGLPYPHLWLCLFFFCPVSRVGLFSHHMGSKVSVWIDYTYIALLALLYIHWQYLAFNPDNLIISAAFAVYFAQAHLHSLWLHCLNSNRILSVRVAVFLCLPNDTSQVTSDSQAFSVKLTDRVC